MQRAISHLHAIGVDVGFGVEADQDLHDPTTVIAHLTAAGLGLPDRDYYLKTEDRFVETRAKYHEHVAKMFVLAGSTPEAAETAATATVFEFEKRLAEATLDNVASRDPFQQDHKTRFDGLKAMAPDFDWASYFDAAKLPRSDLNVTEPKFLQAFNQEVAKTPVDQWRRLPGVARPGYLRRFAVRAIRRAELCLLRQVPQRRDGNEAALEALRRGHRRSAGRGARARLRARSIFRRRPRRAWKRWSENLLLAMHDTIEGLDWMSPVTKAKAQEKLAAFNSKVGYPDKWKDYAGVVIGRDSYFDDVVAATRWNINDNLSPDRQARRSKPLGHDAAHLERLLQPVA